MSHGAATRSDDAGARGLRYSWTPFGGRARIASPVASVARARMNFLAPTRGDPHQPRLAHLRYPTADHR